MKPFFSVLAISGILFFSGCSGGDSGVTVPTETQLEQVNTQGIVIKRPPSWEFLDRINTPDKLPQNVLLLMNSVEPWGKNEAFATVGVSSEALPESTSSLQYAKAAVKKTSQDIINYESISEDEETIGGMKGELLRFRGKNSLQEETYEWFHLFVAKNNVGYVVSGTVPLDASDEQKDFVKTLVLSFGFAPEN